MQIIIIYVCYIMFVKFNNGKMKAKSIHIWKGNNIKIIILQNIGVLSKILKKK